MRKTVFDRIAERFISGSAAQKIISEKVKKELQLLYPTKETEQICRDYYREKISLLLKIWVIGVLGILLMLIAQRSDSLIEEGNIIKRDTEEQEEKQVVLDVYDEDNHVTEITYHVAPQTFTEEEIQKQTERFLEEYESLILGENESLQEVHTHLRLQNSYGTYPMEFNWDSSDYRLVGDDGEVVNENLEKEEIVQLSVEITYGEQEYVHVFNILVVPPKLSDAEEWKKEILHALSLEDELQKYELRMKLPEKISGKQVRFEEKRDFSIILLFALLFAVTILLFFAKDRDLEKELELRKQRMTMKYPEFVSKFQLLLGAGMTVKNVFIRLSEDVSLGNELIEETELLIRDMKNGISVSDALDRFGRRTANPLYIKFSALLIQNMKKGTNDLTEQLSKEAQEAFSIRKSNARQLGEEAGTKLLGPMILMLGVVMAVLMVPAFLSFQF